MKEPYLFKLSKDSLGSRRRFYKMVRLYYLYYHIAQCESITKRKKIRYINAFDGIRKLILTHIRKNYPLCNHWSPERLGRNQTSFNLHHNIDLCFLITLEMKDE